MSETKSMYVEIDRTEGSGQNPPPSTALECYNGCQESLREAIDNRRVAYDRMARFRDEPGKMGTVELIKDKKPEERRKLPESQLVIWNEWQVLEADRRRAESEVAHWRDMIEWWRKRDAEGLNRRYGASLVRELADAKALR